MTFTVIDDAVATTELKELFDVKIGSLANIPGAVKGKIDTNTITILDDDPEVSITVSDDDVSEGSRRTVNFTVRLSAATNKKVRIPFDVHGSATRNSDYRIITETASNYKVSTNYVEINPGKTAAVIRVEMINDSIIEPNETLRINLKRKYGTLRLSNALFPSVNPALNIWAVIRNGSPDPGATTTILSSDGVPVPRISAVRGKAKGARSYSSTSTWIGEGGAFRVTVSLNKKASKDVYVPVSFPKGSGRASSNDFTTSGASKGLVRIKAGTLSSNFYLYTTNDSRVEVDEKIRITLGRPQDSSGKNYGTLPRINYKFVGIRDDDYAPSTVPGTLVVGQYGTYPAPSGSTSSSPTPSTSSAPIPGTGFIGLSFQGYRDGSQVFLDGNLNGIRDFVDFDGDGIFGEFDVKEPLTTTFADGSFLLEVPDAFDRNGNGVLDFDEAQIVSVGGVDISTGVEQKTRLIAAPGDYVATPLTTLVAKLVQRHSLTIEEAHTRVLEALGLPDFEFGKVSAIQAALEGDLSAAESYPATIAVNNVAVVTAHYLHGLTGASVEVLADLVYERLAVMISSADSQVDLSSSALLEILLGDVGSSFAIPQFSDMATALAEGLAAINADLLQLPVEANQAFLEEVVRRKVVARGAMAEDAVLLGSGSLTPAEFLARFTGQPLLHTIQAAVTKTIEPVRLWVSNAGIVEGDDGVTFLEFEAAVSAHFDGEISVDFETEDDTASAIDGDYQAVSGTLSWSPGDAATKTIRIPVNGDTVPELDETLWIRLSNASSGIIQRPIGQGVIRADDAIVVQLDSVEDGIDVIIEVDGDLVSVYQDGESQLDGSLHIDAPLQIVSAAGGQTRFEVSLLSPTTEGRIIQLTSGDEQDELHFSNAAFSVTERVTISNDEGKLVGDGLTLEYDGFAIVTDDHSPLLLITDTPTVNTPLQLNAALPESVNGDEVVYTWSIKLGDNEPSEFTGPQVEFTPTVSGTYQVLVQAELIDGSVGLTRQTFTVEDSDTTAPSSSTVGAELNIETGLYDVTVNYEDRMVPFRLGWNSSTSTIK